MNCGVNISTSRMRKFVFIGLFLLTVRSAHAQAWKPLGPPGGDVRVLATDPSRRERIFLGTADGHILLLKTPASIGRFWAGPALAPMP